jgi:signal transduction histidine kinase
LTLEIMAAALLSIGVAAALLLPLTRQLSASLAALGARAGAIAQGRFEGDLEVKGARELQEFASAFNTMSAQLQSEQARRRRLIADVSHELRSPLGRLRALMETMMRHPDEWRTLLAQTEEEIGLLDRLIADMLETTRLERGVEAIKLEPVSLQDWWAQAAQRLRASADPAAVRFTSHYDGESIVEAIDAQRMFQAVVNVVDNAIAASAGLADPVVEARLTIAEECWTIEVVDQGRGIPAEALPFVFDRFYRVERDRGRSTGGVGLGLSIARAIVEAHGGSIVVESDRARGTVARLRFPRGAT